MDKKQVVSTHQGAALIGAGPAILAGDGSGSQQAQGIVTTLVLRIGLKPERVQQPLPTASQEEVSAYLLELTAHHSQPVTLDLAEPSVTITLHTDPVTAAATA